MCADILTCNIYKIDHTPKLRLLDKKIRQECTSIVHRSVIFVVCHQVQVYPKLKPFLYKNVLGKDMIATSLSTTHINMY